MVEDRALLLRVAEVVKTTGFSRPFIYRKLQEGAIPCVRLGKAVRIPAEWLKAWVERQIDDWEMERGGRGDGQ